MNTSTKKKPSYKYITEQKRRDLGSLRRAPRRLGPQLEQRLCLRVQVRRHLLRFLARDSRTGAQVAPNVEFVQSARQSVPAEVGRGCRGERAPGEAGGAVVEGLRGVGRRGSRKVSVEKERRKKTMEHLIEALLRLLFSFLLSLLLPLHPHHSPTTHRVRICFSIECLAARPAP